MILLCNRLIHSLNSNIYYEPTIKHICAYSSTRIHSGVVIFEIRFQSPSLYNIFKSADDGYMIDIKGSINYNEHKQRTTDKMKALLDSIKS